MEDSGYTSRLNAEVEKSALDASVVDAPVVDTLDDLLRELRLVFESDQVNVEKIQDLMSAYQSNPKEWIQYAKFDAHAYTRNLVDEGNGKYNLILLAWGEGQGSSIHDHANSHCFMKVLSGNLHEVRYDWPNKLESEKEMVRTRETFLKTNDVAYMNDSLGLHLMENPSHTTTAVSLHLYCPPFESVFLFDQQTGHTTRGQVTFWSKYGERTQSGASSAKINTDN